MRRHDPRTRARAFSRFATYDRFMKRGAHARILIVDDDIEVQRVVKRAAEAAGFEVVQALDGAPALALATTEKFDLVLLDIGMPKMDGRVVLARLKQHPNCADVPVLVYSGLDAQTDRHVALGLGAEDFVDKPFDAGFLVTRIERLLEKARERAIRK
jgi:two-component system, OmpR family, KDP operon response regulator KdpE